MTNTTATAQYAAKTVERAEFLAALETGTSGSPNEIRALPNGLYLGVLTGFKVRNDGKVRLSCTAEHPDTKAVKSVTIGIAEDAKEFAKSIDKGEIVPFNVQAANGLTDDNGNVIRYGQLSASSIAASKATSTTPATTTP